ncbi:unnamed protein product [Caenorhabditis brenneri]
MPVPILKLPFLALKVVIACGEDTELIAISLGSRRADRVVKACGRTPSILDVEFGREKVFTSSDKFRLLLSEAQNGSDLREKLARNYKYLSVVVSDVLKLTVGVKYNLRFTLNILCISDIDRYEGYKINLRINGTSVPTIFSDNQVCTFWNERVNGLQFFMKYFGTKFFIRSHYWNFESAVPDFGRLMSYLDSTPHQCTEDSAIVQKVTVTRDAKLSHSDYNCLLATVKGDLKSEMETTDDFKFTGQFSAKNLMLLEAHWFTFDNLLKCKSANVRAYESKFTNRQLKSFIGRWMTGNLTHFDEVKVNLEEEVDLDFILRGIEVEEIPNPPRMSSRGPWSPFRKVITGKTGLEAEIKGKDHWFLISCPKVDINGLSLIDTSNKE